VTIKLICTSSFLFVSISSKAAPWSLSGSKPSEGCQILACAWQAFKKGKRPWHHASHNRDFEAIPWVQRTFTRSSSNSAWRRVTKLATGQMRTFGLLSDRYGKPPSRWTERAAFQCFKPSGNDNGCRFSFPHQIWLQFRLPSLTRTSSSSLDFMAANRAKILSLSLKTTKWGPWSFSNGTSRMLLSSWGSQTLSS